MRRTLVPLICSLALFVAAASVGASGPVGLYGIVEKVVFEPNEAAALRIQVWGAFAYADLVTNGSGGASPARRGYLYFRIPAGDQRAIETVKGEWADLKTVAGTGEAIAFGSWGYIGNFAMLDPGTRSGMPPYILEMYPGRGETTDMRVRPATEVPTSPAVYQTNTGIVKLSDQGSRGDIVRQLRQLLRP